MGAPQSADYLGLALDDDHNRSSKNQDVQQGSNHSSVHSPVGAYLMW